MDTPGKISASPQLAYWRDRKHDAYHLRQFEAPYRSTVRLADFIRSTLAPWLVSSAFW